MTPTWQGPPPPDDPPLKSGGWLRVMLRGGPLLLVLAICFPLLLALRPPERAIWGLTRPVTPWITQAVCMFACWILGLRRSVTGQVAAGEGAFVANHSSWLDIFVLNASARLYFVAKAEVHGWAGIGWLARGTGTLFISRDRREAAEQARAMENRLIAGHKLMFFPEGTSTDGRQVLPFRSTLFQAFFSERLRGEMQVQPISVVYHAPKGADAAFYGWWGDMEFAPNLLKVLGAKHGGRVDVVFHPALKVRDFFGRKELAKAAQDAVRDGFTDRVSPRRMV